MLSIAIYAVFTALQGLSQGIFDFAFYRFIAGLGTGAVLMAGIPLLAETLGETHRAKIAAIMMTRGALGTAPGPTGSSAAMAGGTCSLSASCRQSSSTPLVRLHTPLRTAKIGGAHDPLGGRNNLRPESF